MNTHLDQEKVFLSDWYVDKTVLDVKKDAVASFFMFRRNKSSKIEINSALAGVFIA